MKKSPLGIMLRAGLLAGVLDLIAAVVQYYARGGNQPGRIFQYIASAVFGKEAFEGGAGMVVAGVLFHFLIATIFAFLFFQVYRRWPLLGRNIVLTGLIYGIVVWVIMNRVVLPLSRVKQPPFQWSQALIAMGILMLMVGLPIAIVTNRYSRKSGGR